MTTDTKQKKTTNPLFDPKTDNKPISDESQDIVNKPVEDPAGMDEDDQLLLNLIEAQLEEKKIDLYKPSSFINQDVYDKLDPEVQGKIDLMSFNMLTSIREIHNFHQSDFSDSSYQFINMLHKFRLQKEETEKIHGDIFIF